MKINSCYISSFGKFKNYKIDFADGFNLIYGDNEAGKSTVMSFIKMMFYGNSSRVSDLDKNLRKKYMPWDSSFMAGSIDFTHNGKKYRLEREFRGSNATDKITLTDSLGTVSVLDSKGDVGSKIFGLSLEAFEKTVFISALGAPEKNAVAEGELNGKLSNLTSTGDEDISFEDVSSRIKKAREFYKSKSGKIGVLDKAKVCLAELENELEKAKETEIKSEELISAIKEKEAAASKNTAEANRFFSVMKKAELASKRSNLIKYIEASRFKEEAIASLTLPDGSVADDAYAERVFEAIRNFGLLENSVTEKENETRRLQSEIVELKNEKDNNLSILTSTKEELSRKLETLDNEANEYRQNLFNLEVNDEINRKAKSNLALIIMSVLLLLVAAVCFVVKGEFFWEGIALATISAVLLVFGLFPPKKKRPEKITSEITSNQRRLHSALFEITETQKELEAINLSISSAIAESGGKKALLEAKQKEFSEKSETLLSLKAEMLTAKSALTALCEPFSKMGDCSEIALYIKNTLQDLSAADVMISMAADSTNCQSIKEAETRLAALDSDDTLRGLTNEAVAAAKDEYRRLAEKGAQLRGEIATLKSNLKALISSGQTVPIIEEKIKALKENISSMERFCNAADTALCVLTDSFAAMREGYGGILEAETSNIFSKLTSGAYTSLDISKDFEIKTHKEGVFGAKDWQFLSAGTADQAYLSLRIALSKLIDKELPLIMDDSLAQYDTSRAATALEFLSDHAKEHQLLLFTCHEDIKTKAESLGANTINM